MTRVAKRSKPEPPFQRFGRRQHRHTSLQHIYSDVKGKIATADFWGRRYFITFTCELTRYTCVYFMRKKSEAKSKFLYFYNGSGSSLTQTAKPIESTNCGPMAAVSTPPMRRQ